MSTDVAPASSPPDPSQSRTDPETPGEGSTEAAPKRVVGRPWTSESAREAVAKRVEMRRARQPISRVAGILAAIQTQQDIATSTSSSVPARDRTAASRALPSLYAALDEAQAEEDATTRIPWETMHPSRLTIIEWALHLDDEACTYWVDALDLGS